METSGRALPGGPATNSNAKEREGEKDLGEVGPELLEQSHLQPLATPSQTASSSIHSLNETSATSSPHLNLDLLVSL